jgi:hypothetical protein
VNDFVGYTVTVKVARKSANFRFVRKYIYIILFMAVSPVVCFDEPACLKSLMCKHSFSASASV